MDRPFLRLIIFFSAFLWLNSFLRTIVPPHVFSQGIGFKEMTIGLLVAFFGQILLFFLLNKNVSSKLAWFFGTASLLLSVVLVINVKSPSQYYLSAFFNGLNLYLFFIFYNIAHFEATPRDKTGISSGLMFAIGPVIGIIAPLIAAFLGAINIWFGWGISLISLMILFVLIKLQKDFSISYSILDSIKEIASTRIFIFLEGIWEAVVFGLIPIYTLFFFKTTLEYGTFLAYLSLLSAIATLSIGRLSDRLQKRIIFLYPVTISLAVVTFAFMFASQNINIWIVLSGIVSLLLPIFLNISTAMVVDMSPNLRVSIPGRELVLASGRFLGLTLVLLSFMYEQRPFFIFPVLGSAMFLYPIFLFWSSKIRKKYRYL